MWVAATVLGFEYILRRLCALTVLAARGGGDDDMLRVSRRSLRSDYSNHVEREDEKVFCVMKGDRK